MAILHVYVSTKAKCDNFQKGGLYFFLFTFANRLSTTYLMLYGASTGTESIVAAGCWNWNTDCQRYIFFMNNYFERGKFEFFFLLSKVENGQFILVKIGNLHVRDEKDLTNWLDMNHFPLDTKDSFFAPTLFDYSLVSL